LLSTVAKILLTRLHWIGANIKLTQISTFDAAESLLQVNANIATFLPSKLQCDLPGKQILPPLSSPLSQASN